LALTIDKPNEEFQRCELCDNPYFVKKEMYLIEKVSDDSYYEKQENLRTLGTKIQYICSDCNTPLKKGD